MVELLDNWVKLRPGVEVRLRFSGGGVRSRPITDPVTNRVKTVKSLVLEVTHEAGAPVTKNFSIVSDKLAGEMAAYLDPAKIKNYEFTFVKDGPGFAAPRLVKIQPL